MRDLKGLRSGRLTAIKPAKVDGKKSRSKMWVCKCACGNEIVVRANNFVSGNTRSCGCWRHQLPAKKPRKDHIDRCSNTKDWCGEEAEGYET